MQGLRIREIASEAGMSPAAVLYHYPETGDLVLAVHRDAVEIYIESRRAQQASKTDPRDQIVASILAGVPPFADSDVIRVLYEMHGLANRSAPHSELMTHLWENEISQYVSVLEAGSRLGYFKLRHPVADVAAMLLAMEDGLVLHLTADSRSLEPKQVIELFLRFAEVELQSPGLLRRGLRALTSSQS